MPSSKDTTLEKLQTHATELWNDIMDSKIATTYGLDNGLPRRVHMSPAEWSKIPDCKVQRDTAKRAEKAGHLYVPSSTHYVVSMAELPDGSRQKLDGHTRSYLWSHGTVTAPESLAVDIYYCANQEQVERLYHQFDNKAAVETSGDMVFSAARSAKIEFQSSFMRSGRYITALKSLSSKIGAPVKSNDQAAINKAVVEFKEELKMLDEIKPTATRFPMGVIMGALAAFRRYGPPAKTFFEKFQKGEGIKDGADMDAVQGLSEALTVKRSGIKSVAQKQEDLFSRTLTAYDAYRVADFYNVGPYGGPRPMSKDRIAAYLAHKRKK